MVEEQTSMELSEGEVRTWAALIHLSAALGLVMPLGNVIGTLVIWVIKKDQHEVFNAQGREAVNFQLTILLGLLVSFCLIPILIGIPLFAVVVLYAVIMTIVAAIKAGEGKDFAYPICLRFI